MARILFVAINYWPEPSGTAPYTTRMAEHLVEQGHEVEVITGYPHYPDWKVPSLYGSGFSRREIVNGVNIIRKRHFVPAKQTVAARALYESTFLAHGFATRLCRPDAIIGVIPSLNGGALSRLLAARVRVGYAVIVQDLMGRAAGQSGISAGSRVSGVIGRAEAWSLRRARIVAPVSDAFIPYLKSLGVPDSRLVRLPNWTLHTGPASDRSEVRSRLGWADEQVVLHAGNMGLKQGLEQIVEAARVAAVAAPDVRFVFLGDGSQRVAIQSLAEGLPNVQFLPTQSADDYADALRAADVLLLSERATAADMSLPSKLTAYCAAGRPIVASVREGGATWSEVSRIGAGLLIPAGDARALLGALAELRRNPSLAEELGAKGSAHADAAYSEQAAMARATELVARLLKPSVRARASV